MFRPCLLRITLLLALSLTFAALPALAQNSSTTTSTQTTSSPAAQSSSQTSTSKQTTTTTTTAPTQTTTQATGVDPLWIALGVAGLLALLAIVLLATRGRSRDRVATVRESTTVVKKDE